MASIPLFWCIFMVILSMPAVLRTYTTETKCPIFYDDTWKIKNSQCEEGKKYHCQDNEDGTMEANGCFRDKVCKKGAHPVIIENGQVMCLDCPQKSYQSQDELISSQYTYSMCSPHSTCVPYEQTLCKAGTQEEDTTCQCSKSHRPSSKECSCFTSNDDCHCIFIGCPNGTSINKDGSCDSPTTPIPSPSTNETLPEPAFNTLWIGVAAIIAILIVLAVFVVVCCKKQVNFQFNINRLKTLRISTHSGETGHRANLSHGGEGNGTINQMNTGEEVSPDIESDTNSLLCHGGESNGTIIQMNTDEEVSPDIESVTNSLLCHGGESNGTIIQMNTGEVSPDIESDNNSLLYHGGEINGTIIQMNTHEGFLDMQGHQISELTGFRVPIQVTAIDSLTEIDAVLNGSQEAGINGRPLHEDDTVPKMLCDRTQKSQEKHEFKEPGESDKLLHCQERVLG